VEPTDTDRLLELETSMWRAETRFDPDWMDRHLTDDFLEFGRSGRVYDRAKALSFTEGEIDVVLPLPDFSTNEVAPGVVLVTYRSIRTIDGEVLVANRASLWIETVEGWRMRFHQGTPTDLEA
jgi:hypothetical protein